MLFIYLCVKSRLEALQESQSRTNDGTSLRTGNNHLYQYTMTVK